MRRGEFAVDPQEGVRYHQRRQPDYLRKLLRIPLDGLTAREFADLQNEIAECNWLEQRGLVTYD